MNASSDVEKNLKVFLLLLQFINVLRKELYTVEKERDSFFQEFSEVSALWSFCKFPLWFQGVLLTFSFWYYVTARLQWNSWRLERQAIEEFIWWTEVGIVHCQEEVIVKMQDVSGFLVRSWNRCTRMLFGWCCNNNNLTSLGCMFNCHIESLYIKSSISSIILEGSLLNSSWQQAWCLDAYHVQKLVTKPGYAVVCILLIYSLLTWIFVPPKE